MTNPTTATVNPFTVKPTAGKPKTNYSSIEWNDKSLIIKVDLNALVGAEPNANGNVVLNVYGKHPQYQNIKFSGNVIASMK